jgi:hypothetical protein
MLTGHIADIAKSTRLTQTGPPPCDQACILDAFLIEPACCCSAAELAVSTTSFLLVSERVPARRVAV